MSFRMRKQSHKVVRVEPETDGDKVLDDIMNLEPLVLTKFGNKYIYSSKTRYDPSKHPDVKRETYLEQYKASLLGVKDEKNVKEDLVFDKSTNKWKLGKN